jgi:hypothetical protein
VAANGQRTAKRRLLRHRSTRTADPEEQRTLARRLQASALEYIAIVFSGGGVIPAQAETPRQHLERLKGRFAEAKALNPRFVNLLAGNDRWPLAQQVDFLGKAHELAAGMS